MNSISKIYLCWLLFLSAIIPAHSEEACGKIPQAWSLESRATSGNLCADILLQKGDDGNRKLRVFESGILGFEADEAALCKTCGGVQGDAFQGIQWAGQILSIKNAGGSREVWAETWKFAKREGRWVIAGWERSTLDTATEATWSESVNALAAKATASYAANGKAKGDKRACAHAAKLPAANTVKEWRDKPFACGLKTP